MLKQANRSYSLHDWDIASSRHQDTDTVGDLSILTSIRGGGRQQKYKDQDDNEQACDATSGCRWKNLDRPGEGYCQDAGTGDWD